MKFLLLLCGFTIISWSPHKFYFSETLLEWKEPSSIQMTIKVFADDWALATTSQPTENTAQLDSLFFGYLNHHLFIKTLQNEPIRYSYWGFEKEGEFIYLYLEITQQEKVDLFIHQNILTEVYPEQKNLVNFRCDGITRSLYFFKDSAPQILSWP
jgi:hypothetical protein